MGQSITDDGGFGFTFPSNDPRRPGLLQPFFASFPAHRRAQTEVESIYYLPRTLSRPKSASNLLSTTSDFYGQDLANTLNLGEDVQARRSKDDIAALVDFLKNHEPPPDNFMSIPFSCGGEGDKGRWSARLKNMAKRRTNSLSQVAQHLHLPDSAVSGVTTGGYRHIAISIPIDASPFGEMPRSQYPVFPSSSRPSVPPPRSLTTRTYLNEKGVVTVLRPVTEVTEAPTTTRAASQPYAAHGGAEHIAEQFAKPAPLSGSERKGDVQQKFQDYAPSPFQRAIYPARASSMTTSRGGNHPASIDGLISQSTNNGSSPKFRYGDYQQSIAESVATNGEEPVVGEAMQVRSCKSSPVLVSERDSEMRCNDVGQSQVTVITQCPIVTRNERSPSSTRRDRVREKRRRDMEAILNGTDKRRPKVPKKQASEQPHTGHGDQGSEVSTGWQFDAPQEYTPVGQSTLCPIMVVIDVEPSSSADERDTRKKSPTTRASKYAKATGNDPMMVASLNTAGNPTPPVSPTGSPLKKRLSVDRISLSRRREWNASRESEQRKQGAMAAARVKALQLATASSSNEPRSASQNEKEIVKLYEAFREHRFRDMERRVRRLERNGDIWLQALLPMLESMNETMASVQDGYGDEMRDWATDDEGAELAEQRGRSTERRRLSLRESGSHGRLVENLARRRDGTESCGESVARSDATGLGLIDSLMKELAGETAEKRRSAKAAALSDE